MSSVKPRKELRISVDSIFFLSLASYFSYPVRSIHADLLHFNRSFSPESKLDWRGITRIKCLRIIRCWSTRAILGTHITAAGSLRILSCIRQYRWNVLSAGRGGKWKTIRTKYIRDAAATFCRLIRFFSKTSLANVGIIHASHQFNQNITRNTAHAHFSGGE